MAFEDNTEAEDVTLQSSYDIDSTESHIAKITQRSHKIDLQAAIIRDNVAVPIPKVDRGIGDARNILRVVINKTDNDH